MPLCFGPMPSSYCQNALQVNVPRTWLTDLLRTSFPINPRGTTLLSQVDLGTRYSVNVRKMLIQFSVGLYSSR